nr:hypothetical protein GCM10020063_031420 [Dactylosporangium thailandense]
MGRATAAAPFANAAVGEGRAEPDARTVAATCAAAGSSCPTSASSTCRAVGRAAGSARSARRTIVARDASSPASAGSEPASGRVPVPAQATRRPHAYTSLAWLGGHPRSCSGASQPGVPKFGWCAAPCPSSRATPKSMTFGPNGESSTLRGLRSACTSPTAWMAVSAAATPTATASTCPASGPCTVA